MTGEELRTRREALGLTLDDVAELVGKTAKDRRQIVYRWEKGTRKIPAADAMLLELRLEDKERPKSGNGRARHRKVARPLAGRRAPGPEPDAP